MTSSLGNGEKTLWCAWSNLSKTHDLLVDVEPLPYKDAAVKTDIAPNYDVHRMLCLLMILLLSHILKTTQKYEKFLGVI